MKSGKNQIILTTAIVIIIALLGVIAYLLLKDDTSSQTKSNGSDESMNVSIEEQKVIATIPTQQREISFELMAPQRTGDTLVFNYNLVNTSEENGYHVTDRRAGVYTVESGTESPIGRQIAEAYVTASDGQRYGIVKDESGNPLVTNKIDTSLQPGDKTGGFITVSLPPSGSTISLYPGDIQAINGIKIEY